MDSTQRYMVLVSLFFVSMGNAVAVEKKLASQAIRALIAGKTFDVHLKKKDEDFKVYANSKGLWEVHVGDAIKKRRWKINKDGEFCVKKTIFLKCGDIIDVGNGEFKRTVKGKEVQRLKNFQNGRQFP